MFDLSVCLIVKNEEEVISRCLECCKKFADEIIVVDTGSTDKTKELAFGFTNKIFTFPWNDNFADARNFSFSKATKEYIMWLDADDFITQENINKILNLKKQSEKFDVFMCKYLMDFDENNKANFSFYRERILKRSLGFVWEGFVHEVITPRGKVHYTNIEIEHRKIKKNSDANRNLNIYKKALKNNHKFSPREQYYYSRELFYHKKYKQCIIELKKYLKLNDAYTPNILGAYILLGECFLIVGKIDNALKTCFDAIRTQGPNAELCCLIARCYDILKDNTQSIFWYNTSLISPVQKGGFVRESYAKLIPAIALTKLYFDKGEINKSYHFHQLAKQENPHHPSVVFNERFFENYFKNIKY